MSTQPTSPAERTTWTAERRWRLRALDNAGGDVATARRDWDHREFLTWLIANGRYDEGAVRAPERGRR
jgi:hypothetical protein